MEIIELKYLILAQIGIDLVIFISLILLIKRLRFLNKDSSLKKGLEIYETLLADAVNISETFKKSLQEKKDTIKKLNKYLDKRITNLNALLTRTDAMLFDCRQKNRVDHDEDFLKNHEKEILKLAGEGQNIESIAHTLSIPREEVMLVRDLKEKMSRLNREKGVS